VKSEPGLPRELKRHLFVIEEQIVEALAWQPRWGGGAGAGCTGAQGRGTQGHRGGGGGRGTGGAVGHSCAIVLGQAGFSFR
jgi:hypothetical protein